MKDTAIYNVRVIERAMQILSCFDGEIPERGISEIAHLLGLSPATVLRILVTLQSSGYVERAAGSEKYRLGPRVMEMGLRVVHRLQVCREARPYMVALEKQFEETCDLSVYNMGEMLFVEVVQSRHALRIAGSPGYRSPAHCTASGKAFLAFLPPDELKSVLKCPLKRYTANTITSPEQLLEQLGRIRACGYSADDEELEAGVRAVAAPIQDRTGKVVVVIGMPGPVERMSPQRIREIGEALLAAAIAISALLDSSAEGRIDSGRK